MSEAAKIKALYNARIMELADDIPLQGRLDDADASASVRSPLCGSRITVDLKVQDGVVTDYRHVVRACTLGQAAASIMARHVVGASVAELKHAGAAMRAMLKEGEPLPADVWDDLEVLTPVREFKSRHGSVLLSFDAVEKALKTIGAA
ncbi:MAG: iron-sulfur cluster assembly scaffold protein [Alphaproteobacteria bacterium]|nr:iron-sulfur cluster assembly scaffold protein [Alphaproteobacteria bacterium]MCB9931111.1 iron-sulfur cluster assembly scaffold protein [Alphaproteobacteria bacterium]